MRESVLAALSWIRSNSKALGLDDAMFDRSDFHVHVPAGATPKDGPSAGVTLTVSLVSLLCGIPVPSDLAMTGEITLRGKVLPVGGIKEKVIAAKSAGVKTVILPDKNEKDLEDVSPAVREALSFRFVSEIESVLDIVFGPVLHERARKLRDNPQVVDADLPVRRDDDLTDDVEQAGTPTPVEAEG
jgi:ATP-dependent Lon protease